MSFKTVFDWTEAWAPLIPLSILFWNRQQALYVKPVIVYLIVAFILNTTSNIIWKQSVLGLTLFTSNNNPIYNLHSILRFFLFAVFFIQLREDFARQVKLTLPFAFLTFMLVDLWLWEYFFAPRIAHQLHAAEAGLLLLYCLLYYFFILRNDSGNTLRTQAFWIVSGLVIFVTVCFPIYLFYEEALKNFKGFAINIWSVQKIAFLVLCLAIARAFAIPAGKMLSYE